MADTPPLPTSSQSPLVAGLLGVLPSSHDPVWIGPLMFGTLLQFGVFCVLFVQAVVFFARQGHGLNDSRLFQLYTAAVLLFTTLELTFGVWRIYNICVLLRPWAFLPNAWFEIILTGIVIELVHGFFIYRCYKLSRSKLVLGLILAIFFAHMATATVVTLVQAKAFQFGDIRSATLAVTTMTVLLDTAISSTLFINLWRQRTGHGEIDAVVLRIIRITVESNLPCLVCLIGLLIGSVDLEKAAFGSLFHLTIPLASPLYANALLTTLNSRLDLRRQLDGEQSNGQISIHNNIRFHYTDQSLPASHSQLTTAARSGSTSCDIAFTNVVDGESVSDQPVSKAIPLVSDRGSIPDLRPDYLLSLSSKRARTSPVPPV